MVGYLPKETTLDYEFMRKHGDSSITWRHPIHVGISALLFEIIALLVHRCANITTGSDSFLPTALKIISCGLLFPYM